MDTRKIKKLIELVKETGITELEVKSGEESVRINCQLNTSAPITTQTVQTTALPTANVAESAVTEAEPPTTPPQLEGHAITSPMVGTVYLAPASGARPFVAAGDHVKVGDTLCLIEAMKMFNKIEADINGVVSVRLIEYEQPVEYGQPLFMIEPAE